MAFFGRRPPCVWPDTPLHEVLRLFKTGQGKMALVKDVVDKGHGDPYYTVRGIVTLEVCAFNCEHCVCLVPDLS